MLSEFAKPKIQSDTVIDLYFSEAVLAYLLPLTYPSCLTKLQRIKALTFYNWCFFAH